MTTFDKSNRTPTTNRMTTIPVVDHPTSTKKKYWERIIIHPTVIETKRGHRQFPPISSHPWYQRNTESRKRIHLCTETRDNYPWNKLEPKTKAQNFSTHEVKNTDKRKNNRNNNNNNEEDENEVEQISVWNRNERKYSNYLILHRYWSMQQVNSYVVLEQDRRKFLGRNDIRPPPIVRPTLRIYYTIDVASLAQMQVVVLGVNRTRAPSTYPRSSGLYLYETSAKTSVFERVTVLRQTIEEAFDAWNRALDNAVHFEYVPFSRRLRESTYSNRVIVVSVTNLTHVNEHTGLNEEFTSPMTLAHAYLNFLHVNGQTASFFVAPHPQRSLVQVAGRTRNNAVTTLTVNRETAKNLLGYDSMFEMNKDIEATTYKTIDTKYTYHTCLYCTLLHEISHILGLGHSESRDSVMLDVIESSDQRISETDILAMRKLFSPLHTKILSLERKISKTACRTVKYATPGTTTV